MQNEHSYLLTQVSIALNASLGEAGKETVLLQRYEIMVETKKLRKIHCVLGWLNLRFLDDDGQVTVFGV